MTKSAAHTQEDSLSSENRRIDALTNAVMPRIEADIRSPEDLESLRVNWAKRDAIPRIVQERKDGADHSWLGLDIRTLLLGDESGGRWSIHDVILAPGAELPTFYLNNGHTYYCVADGEVELRIGNQCEKATEEAFGYAPPMTRQGLRNTASKPAQVLICFSPAGSDRAFEAAHAHWLATGEADTAAYCKILNRFGFRFDDAVLDSDRRVNETVEKIPADIDAFDDLLRLRENWARRTGVPKLTLKHANVLDLPGISTVKLVNGDDTAGQSVWSLHAPKAGYYASKHYHPTDEELFYVLTDGAYEIYIGGVKTWLRRGSFAIAPRHATHGGMNKSKHQIRFFGMNSPAGHERVTDAFPRFRDSGRMEELFTAHGYSLLEPLGARY
jgi:quercetin dioxygenase-like cupin family protein